MTKQRTDHGGNFGAAGRSGPRAASGTTFGSTRRPARRWPAPSWTYYRTYDPDLFKVMHDIPYAMPLDLPTITQARGMAAPARA